ncbi:MAG TPA: hypothetical protein VFD92_08580 [Candidatus Binatia bacterium]|nr:hypothetical protein [Candidatus Binatia bacterium]
MSMLSFYINRAGKGLDDPSAASSNPPRTSCARPPAARRHAADSQAAVALLLDRAPRGDAPLATPSWGCPALRARFRGPAPRSAPAGCPTRTRARRPW